MTRIRQDNRRLTYRHHQQRFEKERERLEGEIDYDGLSDDEEEDLQSQQQGMCGNKNEIMKV
jgi:hypothetical protein